MSNESDAPASPQAAPQFDLTNLITPQLSLSFAPLQETLKHILQRLSDHDSQILTLNEGGGGGVGGVGGGGKSSDLLDRIAQLEAQLAEERESKGTNLAELMNRVAALEGKPGWDAPVIPEELENRLKALENGLGKREGETPPTQFASRTWVEERLKHFASIEYVDGRLQNPFMAGDGTGLEGGDVDDEGSIGRGGFPSGRVSAASARSGRDNAALQQLASELEDTKRLANDALAKAEDAALALNDSQKHFGDFRVELASIQEKLERLRRAEEDNNKEIAAVSRSGKSGRSALAVQIQQLENRFRELQPFEFSADAVPVQVAENVVDSKSSSPRAASARDETASVVSGSGLTSRAMSFRPDSSTRTHCNCREDVEDLKTRLSESEELLALMKNQLQTRVDETAMVDIRNRLADVQQSVCDRPTSKEISTMFLTYKRRLDKLEQREPTIVNQYITSSSATSRPTTTAATAVTSTAPQAPVPSAPAVVVGSPGAAPSTITLVNTGSNATTPARAEPLETASSTAPTAVASTIAAAVSIPTTTAASASDPAPSQAEPAAAAGAAPAGRARGRRGSIYTEQLKAIEVKANKRDVDLLHAHIKALENRLSTLGQALDDARESFANRANEMQAHQDAVEMELKSGLAEKASEASVKTATSTARAAQNAVAGLEGRVAALEARSALNRPSSGKGGVQLAPMAPPKELQDMNKHLSNCVAALANLVGVQMPKGETPPVEYLLRDVLQKTQEKANAADVNKLQVALQRLQAEVSRSFASGSQTGGQLDGDWKELRDRLSAHDEILDRLENLIMKKLEKADINALATKSEVGRLAKLLKQVVAATQKPAGDDIDGASLISKPLKDWKCLSCGQELKELTPMPVQQVPTWQTMPHTPTPQPQRIYSSHGQRDTKDIVLPNGSIMSSQRSLGSPIRRTPHESRRRRKQPPTHMPHPVFQDPQPSPHASHQHQHQQQQQSDESEGWPESHRSQSAAEFASAPTSPSGGLLHSSSLPSLVDPMSSVNSL